MEKLADNIKDWTTKTGEKPSASYLAWVDAEIQKGSDYLEANPDKMIPFNVIMEKYGLEY